MLGLTETSLRLFSGNRLNIGSHGCGIVAIAIATGFCLKQFSTHMARALSALGRAAMKAEYIGRTRCTTFFGSTANVFFLDSIANANIHDAIATRY
jgi:hypothetical protein